MKRIDDIDVSEMSMIEECAFWERLASALASELEGATTAGIVRVDDAITKTLKEFQS